MHKKVILVITPLNPINLIPRLRVWCNGGGAALPAALRSACNSVNYRPHSVILFYVGSLTCFKLFIDTFCCSRLLLRSLSLCSLLQLVLCSCSLFPFFFLFVFHPPICLPRFCSASLSVWNVLFSLQSEMNKNNSECSIFLPSLSLNLFHTNWFLSRFKLPSLPPTSSFVLFMTLVLLSFLPRRASCLSLLSSVFIFLNCEATSVAAVMAELSEPLWSH